jgi:DMSO reductase family type II enzyme heme b subunit
MSTTDENSLPRRAALALVAAAAAACRPKRVLHLDHVLVKRAAGALPLKDPGADAWAEASEYEAALSAQRVAPPMLQEPGIPKVRVRALHDGTWLALRLEWDDRNKSALHGPSIFSDAAAVQFPAGDGAAPSVMMGHPGGAVRILYWKAAWQTPDMLTALHPHRPPTGYPFDAAPQEHREGMARQYAPASYVHNPNLERPNNVPVFLGEAEMFGSLTAIPDARTDGKGLHENGRWRVVLATQFPMLQGGVRPGRDGSVAFAVWDGAGKNAGARKMRSDNWARLVVEA